MRRPAMKGAGETGDTRAHQDGREELPHSATPQRVPDGAAGQYQAGEVERPTGMAEEQLPEDRARREQEELRRAREQVREAQANLDEAPAAAAAGQSPAADRGAGQGEDDSGDAPEDTRRDASRAGHDSRPDMRAGSGIAGERQPAPLPTEHGPSGPALKAQSEVRKGEVLVFQGRVLPSGVRPGVASVEMSVAFEKQVENVLSREQYPAHYKEFIRRYFLSLSQGAPAPQPPEPGTR
jgi:hypothetical protein